MPYVTAKHGVAVMTKAANLGYADRGIRINSVHPGYIDTPLLKALSEEAHASALRQSPGRYAAAPISMRLSSSGSAVRSSAMAPALSGG